MLPTASPRKVPPPPTCFLYGSPDPCSCTYPGWMTRSMTVTLGGWLTLTDEARDSSHILVRLRGTAVQLKPASNSNWRRPASEL
eukprot:747453-Hanusia_phi.AAC.2